MKALTKHVLLAVPLWGFATCFWLPSTASAQLYERAPHHQADLFHIFNRADSVVLATVHSAERENPKDDRPSSQFTARLTFTEEIPIKGDRPNMDNFVIPPTLPLPSGLAAGEKILIASDRQFRHRSFRVDAFERATEKARAVFKQATSFPFGWDLRLGKPVSPWTLPAHASFELGADATNLSTCSISGRPAFMTPTGIILSAKAVLPKQRSAGINQYGDGEFIVEVSNSGATTQRIDSLRQRDGVVLWRESLVVDSLGQACAFPRAGSINDTQPVVLGPGETVKGTIDLMELNALTWPTKSGRAPLRLGLGNTVVRLRFHFHTAHHGRLLRQRAAPPSL